jgi:phage repressor protein C with HTH and peptisase S24 domain
LKNISTQKKRIIQYLEYKGVSKNKFYITTGVSNGTLDKKSGLTGDTIEKFYSIYTDINPEWLLTGNGEMIKTEDNNHILPLEKEKKEEIEETRPRIPMDAEAGSLTMAADGITIDDCEQLPVIKAFARYDFTIFARGDSMFPEYHSGDELACLYVKNTTFIQWGCCHVLDTVQGIVMKRIYDDGEYILCKSENSELFKDFKIHKTEVYNIALVIGLVRRY